MSEKITQIIDLVKELSVVELGELVSSFEEEFGVTAAAVAVAGAGAAAGGAAEEEKTEFDVELTSVGDQKIKVIKVVRELTGLGLKEAKEVVDNAPKMIKEGLPKEEAEAEEEKGNYVTEEEPGKFRRIIASPMPIDIYEIDAVKALLDADQIVIAAGGGGIPVLQQGSHLKGASAIIEKDYTAAKLAELVDAETLLFLTAYDKLTIGKGTPDEKSFDNVTASDLHGYIKAGHFPAKTTFPKVDASIRFVTADSSRKAVISNLDKAKLSLAGKSGTTITA